jgi:hypothetical protein
LRKIILNGTDRLVPLGETLGRGGIPPTPPSAAPSLGLRKNFSAAI